MSNPVISIFFKLTSIVLVLNRVLYAMSVYKRITIERGEDIYLRHNFCNMVDHKEIGRHTAICLEAERRLASPVIFHTLHEVVNDTLYRELHFHTVLQISLVVVSVMILGAFHSKYIKSNNQNLPTRNVKQLKID